MALLRLCLPLRFGVERVLNQRERVLNEAMHVVIPSHSHRE